MGEVQIGTRLLSFLGSNFGFEVGAVKKSHLLFRGLNYNEFICHNFFLEMWLHCIRQSGISTRNIMTYTLYGSQTSPFVRRLRMLMQDLPYEFQEMNIFEGQDAVLLNKINPLNQVPVLKHGEKTIWDSRQIFQYLNQIHGFESLSWEDENLLTAIEGAMASGIALLMMKRSGMNIEENFMYINRQKDRIESVLDYLKPWLSSKASHEWSFSAMSLFSFLEWAMFRSIISIDKRPECQKFLESHSQRPEVTATQIPKV